jgi:hypothetical protein
VVGDGPLDLVLVLGFATHIELQWESPAFAQFFDRISSFSRLIIFDKRGTGLSDRVADDALPTLETRMDDLRPSWTRPVRIAPPCSGCRKAAICRSCLPQRIRSEGPR